MALHKPASPTTLLNWEWPPCLWFFPGTWHYVPLLNKISLPLLTKISLPLLTKIFLGLYFLYLLFYRCRPTRCSPFFLRRQEQHGHQGGFMQQLLYLWLFLLQLSSPAASSSSSCSKRSSPYLAPPHLIQSEITHAPGTSSGGSQIGWHIQIMRNTHAVSLPCSGKAVNIQGSRSLAMGQGAVLAHAAAPASRILYPKFVGGARHWSQSLIHLGKYSTTKVL